MVDSELLFMFPEFMHSLTVFTTTGIFMTCLTICLSLVHMLIKDFFQEIACERVVRETDESTGLLHYPPLITISSRNRVVLTRFHFRGIEERRVGNIK